MTTTRPYYDHDESWENRAQTGHPVWGGQSFRVYAQLTALLVQHQPPPARIVDIGCGAGAFGRTLQAAGYNYVGVDESPVAIELGHRSFPELDLRRHDGAKASLKLDGSPFDVVTAVNVLHCLVEPNDRAHFLANLRAQVGLGGRLCLTTMCAPALPGARLSKHPRLYLPVAEIRAELAHAGWKHILAEEHQDATAAAKIANWLVVATPSL